MLSSAYLYPAYLAALSLAFVGLERAFPWRKQQPQVRAAWGSDALHLLFNGHFLGLMLAGLASTYVLPALDAALDAVGLRRALYAGAAGDWPLWLQAVTAVVALDLMQWGIHNLLHRVPWLWTFHKAHHSVGDGEMDWIVSFRFVWLEVVVYRALQYLPLAYLGFRWQALLTHALVSTLMGHLNHANLRFRWGPLRYVLNGPRMHLWHHDRDRKGAATVNFGIIFSAWDWLFGTAYLPASQTPRRLGFEGDGAYPRGFFAQQAYPLQRLLPGRAQRWGTGLGIALLALLGWLASAG